MSILDTHTSFIKYAQEQYQEAVNQQQPAHAQFWLEQLQLLCQQMYWLSQAAGPPVAIATMPQGLEYQAEPAAKHPGGDLRDCWQSVVRHFSQTPGSVVAEHSPAVRPATEYQWNDGFEGVTLDMWGDKQ